MGCDERLRVGLGNDHASRYGARPMGAQSALLAKALAMVVAVDKAGLMHPR